MSLIRLVDVTFAYPQQSSLIKGCTLELRAGWTGLVGRNGEGKSTLLDLVDGTLQAQRGRIDHAAPSIARCRQRVASCDDVADFANAWTKNALRWMSLLGLEAEDFWRWDELSPGTRRRWQIGAALAADPGVLLLDEPTNHLDTVGRELLISALSHFEGVGVVVSHDRELLDRLCDATARIHAGEVRLYDGGYSVAREAWRTEAASALAELELAQDRARALKAQLNARSHRHSTAQHALSTRSRMSSVRDSDARSTAAKARAQGAEAGLSRQKRVARAQLERAQVRLAEMDRPEAGPGEIFVDAERCPRAVALRFDGCVEVAGRVLVDHIRLEVARDQRLWLRGANGCGKTTLIAAALRSCDLPPHRILHMPQHLDPVTVRASFGALDADDRQRAIYVGAALCLDVAAVLDGTPLSPGEVRKLAVAVGLVHQPWLIVLDEPTNDLDIDAVERLEAALGAYPGALLLVTHDSWFSQALGCESVRFAAAS